MNEKLRLSILADDPATAAVSAGALADSLREADGVLEIERSKVDKQTMDIGAIVSVVATSGATLAIAQGLAAWLRGRRGVSITIEKSARSGGIKAAVSGIDPKLATRIIEIIRKD